MKTTARFFILLVTLALVNLVGAQALETNAAGGLLSLTNTPPISQDKLIPLIQMEDVPITRAIELFARQANINYMIDPYRGKKLTGSLADNIPEPTLTLHLQNVTARDTLTRMLNVRNFALVEDRFTGVARITRAGQATNVVDVKLLGMDTNNPIANTNEIIPLMQFSDVPLDTALEHLIRQSELNITLDSRLSDNSDPHDLVPTVNFRWTDISAKQAIVALCLNYDLIIVKDAATGGVRIKPSPARKPHHLWHQ
jgi:hypothetical protein